MLCSCRLGLVRLFCLHFALCCFYSSCCIHAERRGAEGAWEGLVTVGQVERGEEARRGCATPSPAPRRVRVARGCRPSRERRPRPICNARSSSRARSPRPFPATFRSPLLLLLAGAKMSAETRSQIPSHTSIHPSKLNIWHLTVHTKRL